MPEIYLIAHNIRSAHNIGSLMRTAEGLGVKKLYITGYSPYPRKIDDQRLPHIALKLDRQIQKTSLDSQQTLDWEQIDDIYQVVKSLNHQFIPLAVLEQTKDAVEIHKFQGPEKLALLIGSEVDGVSSELIKIADYKLIIPMFGQKESFNVVQATAMALYQLTFY